VIRAAANSSVRRKSSTVTWQRGASLGGIHPTARGC
jgi:hypothetical protein